MSEPPEVDANPQNITVTLRAHVALTLLALTLGHRSIDIVATSRQRPSG